MTEKLEQAISAVKSLPDEEQDAIAAQMLAELSCRDHSALTATQQSVIAQRLNEPFSFASAEEVVNVLQKY